VTEFEIQRALDLPDPLPRDEPVLWIGSPSWRGIAREVFHLRALSAYFGVVMLADAGWSAANGTPLAQAAVSSLGLLPLGLASLGMFTLLAWMMARSTTYAFTDKRVFMRIGVALSITLTIPFKCVGSADLRLYRDGSGDFPLSLTGNDRMAYLHLWPHARPWRMKDTVPMMRCVPDAARVAHLLSTALAEHLQGGPAAPRIVVVRPQSEPQADGMAIAA
jgi:Bacterial PH domain